MCLRGYSEELFIQQTHADLERSQGKFDEVNGSRIFRIYKVLGPFDKLTELKLKS